MDEVTLAVLMTPGIDFPDFTNLIRRPEWYARSACGGGGTAPFFLTLGGDTKRARAICSGCEVMVECRTMAMSDPELVGIWAGTTAKERAVVRAAIPAAA